MNEKQATNAGGPKKNSGCFKIGCLGILGAFSFVIVVGTCSSLLIAQPEAIEKRSQNINNNKVAQQRVIDYQIVEQWDVGASIVFSRDYLNDTDMTILCNQIESKYKNDKSIFIYFYTDSKAATLREVILNDDLSQSDLDLYNQNFVGRYFKNGSTNFNECLIYFDGVEGENQKTISY